MTSIDGKRSWVRIMYEKKKGRFVRLMEAMNNLGLELTDTSVTTTNGAVLISSCLEVKNYFYNLIQFIQRDLHIS